MDARFIRGEGNGCASGVRSGRDAFVRPEVSGQAVSLRRLDRFIACNYLYRRAPPIIPEQPFAERNSRGLGVK